MLQVLGTPGYTCNHLRLLSQNSFEDVELPLQVKNLRCSHGFTKWFVMYCTVRELARSNFVQFSNGQLIQAPFGPDIKQFSLLILKVIDYS